MIGKRGEGWVVVQFLLLAVIAVAPRASVAWPAWTRFLGVALLGTGGALGGASALKLGRNLTPLPAPVAGGELVTAGAYGMVRHPIYLALLLLSCGWSLWRSSGAGLLLTVLLFAFLDVKSRREEQWLAERFSGYVAYRGRVRRLIPWLY